MSLMSTESMGTDFIQKVHIFTELGWIMTYQIII